MRLGESASNARGVDHVLWLSAQQRPAVGGCASLARAQRYGSMLSILSLPEGEHVNTGVKAFSPNF